MPGSNGPAAGVEVGPLDWQAFETVVRRGSRLSKPVLRQLHVACDGNPLFGLEVAALLAERGLPDDPTTPIPMPPSASDAIGRRVAKLGPATGDVLLGAAALPRPTVDVLLAAYQEQSLEAALVEAVAAGMVEIDCGRVRFGHPLMAAAVYGAATPARRRAAHARLLRVLVEPEERAPHPALAATRPSANVAAELETAAAAARARGALDAAGRLFDRQPRSLLRARPWREGDEASRLRAAISRPATPTAPASCSTLCSSSLDPARSRQRSCSSRARGRSYSRRGFGYAYAALENAQESPALAVRIHHCLMALHVCAGEAELSVEHAHAALATAEALGDEATLATAISGAGSLTVSA